MSTAFLNTNPPEDGDYSVLGVTHLIQQYRDDAASVAAAGIFEKFRIRIVGLIKKRTSGFRVNSVEDVVSEVFSRLFTGLKQGGEFGNVSNSVHLWNLLCQITARRIVDISRYELASKRDVRRQEEIHNETNSRVYELPDEIPDPQIEAEAIEMFGVVKNLVATLNDEKLNQILMLKLDEHSTTEIANRLGISRATVDRKWRRIIGCCNSQIAS